MRLFITNLLIAVLLVLPLQAWVSPMQCGCVDQCVDEPADDTVDCCNPYVSEQSENQSEEPIPAPCDPQDCPASCCSMTLASACVLPIGTELITISTEHQVQSLFEQSACMSPHLLRLKRPPRSA